MEVITPAVWIIMAIAAQFIWACGNYLDNFLLKRYRSKTAHGGPGTIIFVSSVTASLAALVIATGAQIIPLFGYEGETTLTVTPLQAFRGLFVGVVQVGWMVCYLYALDQSDETESVPLFQSVPIFALILGLTVFDEVPTLAAVTGSFIIVLGSLLLNFNLGTMRLNQNVVILMLTASLLVALVTFLFKSNAEATNFFSSAFWMKLGMFISGLIVCYVVPSFRRQFTAVMKSQDWRGKSINIINEIFDCIAGLIFFGAVLLAPSVMSVQATAAYQPLFIFLIGLTLAKSGSIFHAERYKRTEFYKKAFAAALIGLGSYFIFT